GQQSGVQTTTPPPANQYAQWAGLGLSTLGLLSPGRTSAAGGRIVRRGFAAGGAPGAPYGGMAMPYAGANGYVPPPVQMQPGNTMPQAMQMA
ncbi:hypothetical protein LAJ57_12795, partial [Streptococcus pneumoniae]|uniref:hypothetical protein n=1 Tax=Streptococcus pneumoniae TaxID=1313 RepID=UPI001CC027DF